MIRWLKRLVAPGPVVERFENEVGQVARGVRNSRDVDAKEVERLKRLSEFVDIERKARPIAQRRLELLLTLSVVALLVGVAFAKDVWSTPITLEVVSSHARLRGDSLQSLREAFGINVVTIDSVVNVKASGKQRTKLPDAQPVTLAAADTLSAMTIGQIDLDTGSLAIWSTTEGPRSYVMQISQATEAVMAFGTRFRLITGDAAVDSEFASLRNLSIRRGKKPLTLSFNSVAAYPGALAQPLWIRDADFSRDTLVARRVPNSREVVYDTTTVSAIDSAVITFLDFDNRRVVLRAPERVRFSGMHGGVTALRLDDSRLHMTIEANIDGVERGHRGQWQSLQPTVFDWIRSRTWLAEMWTAAAFLLTAAFAAARYWDPK